MNDPRVQALDLDPIKADIGMGRWYTFTKPRCEALVAEIERLRAEDAVTYEQVGWHGERELKGGVMHAWSSRASEPDTNQWTWQPVFRQTPRAETETP